MSGSDNQRLIKLCEAIDQFHCPQEIKDKAYKLFGIESRTVYEMPKEEQDAMIQIGRKHLAEQSKNKLRDFLKDLDDEYTQTKAISGKQSLFKKTQRDWEFDLYKLQDQIEIALASNNTKELEKLLFEQKMLIKKYNSTFKNDSDKPDDNEWRPNWG